MRSLYIINKQQYGYHTDTFKYTCYLKNFHITYICFDTGKKKLCTEDVQVIYVPWGSSRIANAWRFFRKVYKILKEAQGNDIVFIKNFELCFLITFFNSKIHFLLDLRTLGVTGSSLKRAYLDTVTKLNTFFFDHISVISEGLAERLRLSHFYILPLGADVISEGQKNYNIPKLLYIGTLNNRNIDEVVKGYCEFLTKNEFYVEESEFHIVGDGYQQEVEAITKAIDRYDRFSNITYHGYKSHDEAAPLFEKCNIGISFVPQTDYYDYQPPTKVFEYLLSGLVCVATNTSAHRGICDEVNSILCEDNAGGINSALETFLRRNKSYSSEMIRNGMKDNRWIHVVQEHLRKNILEDIS